MLLNELLQVLHVVSERVLPSGPAGLVPMISCIEHMWWTAFQGAD
jgi:hypothetical protein